MRADPTKKTSTSTDGTSSTRADVTVKELACRDLVLRSLKSVLGTRSPTPHSQQYLEMRCAGAPPWETLVCPSSTVVLRL